MVTNYREPQRTSLQEVHPYRLWAGGLATAVVAALLVAAVSKVLHSVFGIVLAIPGDTGAWGPAEVGWYAAAAALAALMATALMHLLIICTPRPMRFFCWIVLLETALTVAAPFGGGAARSAELATAGLNLLLGLAIGTLVAGAASGG